MPGFELWSDKERKELIDVVESGILMRYGFDGARNGHWKAKNWKRPFLSVLVAGMHNWCQAVRQL
jgi:8-amino-3,8-dideoxy-alpha-D-manno-octulosonate transaminase